MQENNFCLFKTLWIFCMGLKFHSPGNPLYLQGKSFGIPAEVWGQIKFINHFHFVDLPIALTLDYVNYILPDSFMTHKQELLNRLVVESFIKKETNLLQDVKYDIT